MNAFKSGDEIGPYFVCAVCSQDYFDKSAADACCVRLVQQSDPTVGRQPKKGKEEGYVPYPTEAVDADRYFGN